MARFPLKESDVIALSQALVSGLTANAAIYPAPPVLPAALATLEFSEPLMVFASSIACKTMNRDLHKSAIIKMTRQAGGLFYNRSSQAIIASISFFSIPSMATVLFFDLWPRTMVT